MKYKIIAAIATLAAIASGASSCSAPEGKQNGDTCHSEGTWITDQSDTLAKGYTVIVRICVSPTGKILDLEVD